MKNINTIAICLILIPVLSGAQPSMERFGAPFAPLNSTAQISINANTGSACSITTLVGDLPFGHYNAFNLAPLNGTTTFGVTCTPATTYRLQLSAGQNSIPTFSRRMKKLGGVVAFLSYNLFTSAAYTNIWGTGASGTSQVSGVGTGSEITYTVFGQIPPSQFMTPANYRDTVIFFLLSP